MGARPESSSHHTMSSALAHVQGSYSSAHSKRYLKRPCRRFTTLARVSSRRPHRGKYRVVWAILQFAGSCIPSSCRERAHVVCRDHELLNPGVARSVLRDQASTRSRMKATVSHIQRPTSSIPRGTIQAIGREGVLSVVTGNSYLPPSCLGASRSWLT